MRVFLSYNNRDQADAERLRTALLRERPNLDIYFAPRKNQIGAYWIHKLGEELDSADAMLLLLREGVGPWQELEYYEALKRNRKTQRPLIAPVLLGETMPGLYFLDHFHRLNFGRHSFQEIVKALDSALEGVQTDDDEPLWRQTNPYRGLPAMRTEDAAFFFGREKLTGEILDAIRRSSNRVMALVGNSGVGKSSIVQAGILASLRSRIWPGDVNRDWPADLEASSTWLVVVLKPGDAPMKSLVRGFARSWLCSPGEIEAEALSWAENFRKGSDLGSLVDATLRQVALTTGAEPPPRAILYVDQGEELYSRSDPEEARLFSKLLAQGAARPNLLVLTSLRSDYYGHLQEDKMLFETSDRIDIPPLSREAIETVIKAPASRLGARFENPEIVPVIAEAAAQEAGSLPMLSYLLSDAWEAMRREDDSSGILRFPYEIVDVSRPLVDRAERFMDLHPDSIRILQRLFTLKLAYVPKKGEAVRRRARRSECSDDEWALVGELAGSEWRLLTTEEVDEPAVEVSHEALLRKWPRLSRWLEESREFLIWKGQLEIDRREYEAAPKADKLRALLSGLRLDAARNWLEKRGDDISDSDRAFIEASIGAAEDRRHRELRSAERAVRQRRWIARLSTATALIFAVAGGIAAWQWRDAARSKSYALSRLHQAQIAQARFLASKAAELSSKGDHGTAVAIAISAMPEANPNGWPEVGDILEIPRVLVESLLHLREHTVLRGHSAPVERAVFSPDGLRIVTASRDGAARLWEADSGAAIATLTGHERAVLHAAFSPDGKRIVTASEDRTARLWKSASGEATAILSGHEDKVASAVFSPDGTRIVTTSWDRTARLWEAVSGKEIAILIGHRDAVKSAAFSPDGTRIATASRDRTARLWQAASGKEIATLRGHEDAVEGVAFSRDGTRVVTASRDHTARLWEAASGKEIAVLRGHEHTVLSVAFSPDGTQVITTSRDRTVRLWQAASGKEIATLRGHEDVVESAAFSPDGANIITASWDQTARLWEIASGMEIATLRGHGDAVVSAAFSPDGTRIVTASEDRTARLWKAASGKGIDGLKGHKDAVESAAFSPSGMLVVTASEDRTARLWQATSGKEIATLRGHKDAVGSAHFSPDGAHVVTASEDRTVRLWDAASGKAIATLEGHKAPVKTAAFSPDGARIVTASEDHTVRLWDAASGKEIAAFEGHDQAVLSAVFSPDGAGIVTASRDGTARLWDVASGKEIAIFRGHRGTVASAAFSPEGTQIVTASGDGTAQVWEAATGREIATLRGHEDEVKTAAFSPDGKRIVTASWDRTARLWEAASGKEIATLRGHKNALKTAAFSPDGAHIVTASWDGTALVWRHYQSNDELYAAALVVVQRLGQLTEAEKCAYYIKTESCSDQF